jgi:hypothetical protein
MKFYYENDDYKNIPNGIGNTCIVSDLDFHLGFNNATLSLDIDDTIFWNFTFFPYSQIVNNNIEYFENIFNKIKNNSNIKLIFSNVWEGEGLLPLIESLITLKRKYNLENHRIIIITINAYNFQNYSKEIKIISKPYLSGFLADEFRELRHKPFEYDGNEIEICNTFDYLNTPKDKFFLTYNKNVTKHHRIKLILWLIKNKLLDSTIFSLLIKDLDENLDFLISNKDELKELNKYYEEFLKLGYSILDWNLITNNRTQTDLKYTTKLHYSSTIFNIVSETSFSNKSLNLTEKSYKPLANCHPFLIIGDPYVNSYLKDLGFYLYDDLIDYTFDSILDDDERLDTVFKEIKRIYKLGDTYIMNWYKKNELKIKKNQEIFFQHSCTHIFLDIFDELKTLQ